MESVKTCLFRMAHVFVKSIRYFSTFFIPQLCALHEGFILDLVIPKWYALRFTGDKIFEGIFKLDNLVTIYSKRFPNK